MGASGAAAEGRGGEATMGDGGAIGGAEAEEGAAGQDAVGGHETGSLVYPVLET